MLVGKPDKNTEHMASLVSRQLDNRSGYNVLTGKVLQAFGVAESSGVEVEKSLRRVSKHLLNQLKELLELRGALPLSKLHGEYEEEFGYKLEWRNLGFSCLEDLFTSDVEAVALFRLVPELHGWVVMLKEEEREDYSSFRRNVLVPKSVQVNLKQKVLLIQDQLEQLHSGIFTYPSACKTSGCCALSSFTCLQPVSVLLYTKYSCT